MASSNRHWPSMFKSKPHQWQHEVNSSLISNGCHRSSYSSEERTPEPKPRWNPRPEQIRILESIFDSGMVNPPRDEIRKIRAQLQEYGQVGDANVFYWFQNRKSRSKHKLRNLSKQQRHKTPPQVPTPSSSENKSPTRSKSCTNNVFTSNMEFSPYFPVTQEGILTEPFVFQGNELLLPEVCGGGGGMLYGGGQLVGPSGTFMLSEMMNNHHHGSSNGVVSKKVKTMATSTHNRPATSSTYSVVTPISSSSSCASTVTVPFLSSITPHPPSLHAPAAVRTTTHVVFINDVAFEVMAEEPFNVRATFGDEAVLLSASGEAVAIDDWGVTLHPLRPGALYYLIW